MEKLRVKQLYAFTMKFFLSSLMIMLGAFINTPTFESMNSVIHWQFIPDFFSHEFTLGVGLNRMLCIKILKFYLDDNYKNN